MSSIRKQGRWIIGLVLLGAIPMAGCQDVSPTPAPAALDQTPIKVDEAMAARTWDVTGAEYQNDSVPAGPTLALLQPAPNPYLNNAVLEPALFIGNIIILPYALVKTPPGATIEYKSLNMEPTYTANPPLPPSPAPPAGD